MSFFSCLKKFFCGKDKEKEKIIKLCVTDSKIKFDNWCSYHRNIQEQEAIIDWVRRRLSVHFTNWATVVCIIPAIVFSRVFLKMYPFCYKPSVLPWKHPYLLIYYGLLFIVCIFLVCHGQRAKNDVIDVLYLWFMKNVMGR